MFGEGEERESRMVLLDAEIKSQGIHIARVIFISLISFHVKFCFTSLCTIDAICFNLVMQHSHLRI